MSSRGPSGLLIASNIPIWFEVEVALIRRLVCTGSVAMAQHDLDNFLLLSSYLHFTTYYRSVVVVRSSFGGDGGRSSLCVFEVLLSLAAGREKRVNCRFVNEMILRILTFESFDIMWFNIIFFL